MRRVFDLNYNSNSHEHHVLDSCHNLLHGGAPLVDLMHQYPEDIIMLRYPDVHSLKFRQDLNTLVWYCSSLRIELEVRVKVFHQQAMSYRDRSPRYSVKSISPEISRAPHVPSYYCSRKSRLGLFVPGLRLQPTFSQERCVI